MPFGCVSFGRSGSAQHSNSSSSDRNLGINVRPYIVLKIPFPLGTGIPHHIAIRCSVASWMECRSRDVRFIGRMADDASAKKEKESVSGVLHYWHSTCSIQSRVGLGTT
jgi:hypothetical protein